MVLIDVLCIVDVCIVEDVKMPKRRLYGAKYPYAKHHAGVDYLYAPGTSVNSYRPMRSEFATALNSLSLYKKPCFSRALRFGWRRCRQCKARRHRSCNH